MRLIAAQNLVQLVMKSVQTDLRHSIRRVGWRRSLKAVKEGFDLEAAGVRPSPAFHVEHPRQHAERPLVGVFDRLSRPMRTSLASPSTTALGFGT
jgi:hypothetical protein